MIDEKPLVFVDTAEKLRETAQLLSASRVIGLDTESDSFYHYREKVCLIQFSTLDHDFIVDPLALDDLEPLRPILAEPAIVKVLHGADYDVVCLNRDFDFRIHPLFDTLIAAQLLGLPRFGLADLVERYFGVEVEKKYQRHDWSLRPLEEEHIEYARGDTQYLIALREILLRGLHGLNRVSHHREECRILEKRRWTRAGFDPDGYLSVKGSTGMDDAGMRILKRAYAYRNAQAERMDRPPFKVLPDGLLVAIARQRPKTDSAMERLLPRKRGQSNRHSRALLECVELGLQDDFPIPKQRARRPRKKRKGVRPRLSGRNAERVLEGLKAWRNDIVRKDPLRTANTVVSNAVLKAIAYARPTTLEELAAIEDVRQWQVQDFGTALLAVLDEIAPVGQEG